MDDSVGLPLAGQTAPGGGGAVADHAVKFCDCEDVVVRHMHFRLGDRYRTNRRIDFPEKAGG